MASKTVLIVGGVIVALGAVAYLASRGTPTAADTAGTIVEAKRARADGASATATASVPVASPTDNAAAEAAKAKATSDAAAAADAAAASGDGNAGLRRAQPKGAPANGFDFEKKKKLAYEAKKS